MLIFIYFCIYSFIGYICEVMFCSFGQRRLVNRGFLYLPICPIYGIGSIIVLLINKFTNNYILIFIFSIITTSVVEYITSYLLEIIFKIRLWDYSDKKYNLNGRICLKNSILFGVMAIVMTFIHPYIIDFVNIIDDKIINILGIILAIFILLDFVFSIFKYINLSKILENMYNYMEERLDILNDKQAITLDFFENSKFAKKMRRFIYSYPNSKKNKEKLKDIYNKYYK